jgi:hypothetical protein
MSSEAEFDIYADLDHVAPSPLLYSSNKLNQTKSIATETLSSKSCKNEPNQLKKRKHSEIGKDDTSKSRAQRPNDGDAIDKAQSNSGKFRF